MYLLFETTPTSLRYGAYTLEADVVYEGECAVDDWSPRALKQVFTSVVMSHLRAHGRVFTRLGFLVPYASPEYSEPKIVHPSVMKLLGQTVLERKLLEPLQALVAVAQSHWPHLPSYFLFDTYLSKHLERHIVVPPFSYEVNKTLRLAPSILHSYGHKANALSVKATKRSFLSIYIGTQVSMVLFRDGDIRDAHVSFSPASPLMGLNSCGALDPGFFLNLADKKRLPDVHQLLVQKSGLFAMTDGSLDFETLLSISGLVPRSPQSEGLSHLSIEVIEWIELSMRTFIRSLRHGIGALVAADEEVASVVVSSPTIKSTSRLWSLVFAHRLASLKPHFATYSLLQAACHDLAKLES